MITTSIKLSIEVENGDETEKDEFLKTISYLYHYEFVKENSGYGNKRYLQYLLTPAVHHSCGRKRKLSPEEEEEVRKDHFDHARCSSQLREKKKTLPRRRGRGKKRSF